jgi:hypothetical protein
VRQVVRRQLDGLVAPFRGAVATGDQAGTMHPAKVAVDEAVTILGLLAGARGEPEEPLGVLVEAMFSTHLAEASAFSSSTSSGLASKT